MSNQSKPYKNAPVLFIRGLKHGQVAELDILVDSGPLCVAPVWNWVGKEKAHGLYFVYFKRHGLHFGPFYGEIVLAARDMKKVLKAFPQKYFWNQSLEWYQRQMPFHEWIEKNMGKPEDLIGGVWIKEKAESAPAPIKG